MCGILGIYKRANYDGVPDRLIKPMLRQMFLESQSRGKDSSGLLTANKQNINLVKHSCTASILTASKQFEQALDLGSAPYLFAMGHSRMETNGSFLVPENNQPVFSQGVYAIHNGIIVNTEQLWKDMPHLTRQYQVDTEIISAMCADALRQGRTLGEVVTLLNQKIEGSFSLAIFADQGDGLLLTSNTGSLHALYDAAGGFLLFVSEMVFLENLIKKFPLLGNSKFRIQQVEPGSYAAIQFSTGEFFWSRESSPTINRSLALTDRRTLKVVDMSNVRSGVRPRSKTTNIELQELTREVESGFRRANQLSEALRRCSKCVLPETMPFIAFDEAGVCNYCSRYQKKDVLGLEHLRATLDQYKQKAPSERKQRCILSFSGGRDSSFALHYAVRELKLKPLAFSYDWGMLTDLGRRNQARMIGKLGIEHILVSADIQKKRKNIQRNVSAWLNNPVLGLIPLFMAGDKQYFYYLNRTHQATGADFVIYAENALEKTDFKYGFANVDIGAHFGKGYDIGAMKSLGLAWYYFAQFVSNPRYINPSILDTIGAYFSSYALPKEYIYLFNFIPWLEDQVEKTLVDEYNWELAPDTKSSWRIGDGTQAFYNYAYYVGSGLTEHDTLRSNQIREGHLSRDMAFELIKRDNIPRVESLVWYFETIGIPALPAIKGINAMRKHPLLETRRHPEPDPMSHQLVVK